MLAFLWNGRQVETADQLLMKVTRITVTFRSKKFQAIFEYKWCFCLPLFYSTNVLSCLFSYWTFFYLLLAFPFFPLKLGMVRFWFFISISIFSFSFDSIIKSSIFSKTNYKIERIHILLCTCSITTCIRFLSIDISWWLIMT